MSLDTLASVIGWGYAILWSIAVMPQAISNFRNKSVSGYSIEFLVLNMIGYAFYFVYVWVGAWCQRHYGMTETILLQDHVFVTTASIVVFTVGVQAFILYPTTRTESFSPINLFFVVMLLSLALYNVIIAAGNFLPWWSQKESPYTYSVLHYLAFGKSFCSLVKYIPQVILNYKKKNTFGYNILNVIFDISGGSLSILQMVIKCFAHKLADGSPDWSYLTGNAPKTFLSFESVFFNIIFLVQHYFIYHENNAKMYREHELNAKPDYLLADVNGDDPLNPELHTLLTTDGYNRIN